MLKKFILKIVADKLFPYSLIFRLLQQPCMHIVGAVLSLFLQNFIEKVNNFVI